MVDSDYGDILPMKCIRSTAQNVRNTNKHSGGHTKGYLLLRELYLRSDCLFEYYLVPDRRDDQYGNGRLQKSYIEDE